MTLWRNRRKDMDIMNRRLLAVAFGFVLLGSVFAPRARADEDNKEVHFTVNTPVEIPGRVLGAGSYDLKLAGEGSTVAGLWNVQGTEFYGFFDTIPIDRTQRGNLRIDLSGSGKNAPKRFADWFYPGDKQGNELLYPAVKSVEVARGTTSNPGVNR
jgi:hypothetical protein